MGVSKFLPRLTPRMPLKAARSRLASRWSTPRLLKPMRLMMASAAGQAEQAGLGIAGLGPGRHRAHLDEAEAELAQGVDGLAVLVQAGGQAHRVGKVQAHHPLGQGGDPGQEGLQQAQAVGVPQPGHGQVVGGFRVELEQQGFGEGVGIHDREGYKGKARESYKGQGTRYKENLDFACPLPLAPCPLPLAPCPLPLAPCPLPLAPCPLPLAPCPFSSPSRSPPGCGRFPWPGSGPCRPRRWIPPPGGAGPVRPGRRRR
jgi:hypothetical protein